MSKHFLAKIAGSIMHTKLLFPVRRKFFRGRLPIIFYHGLWPSGSEKIKLFWGYRLEAIRNEMRELSRRFRFVSLDDIICMNEAGTEPAEPVMAFSFDDGHDMIRTGALEVLGEFGIRATNFVTTACIGNKRLMWTHAFNAIYQLKGEERFLKEFNQIVSRGKVGPEISSMANLQDSTVHWPMHLKDEIVGEIYRAADMPKVEDYLDQHRPYMDWEDLKKWMSHGHTVGLHTRTHPYCSRLRPEDIETEIVQPANELRERLGIASLAFAYPFGDRLKSEETERVVSETVGLSAMLGVGGVSRIGTKSYKLERVDAERGLYARLYGKPILRAMLDGATGMRYWPSVVILHQGSASQALFRKRDLTKVL